MSEVRRNCTHHWIISPANGPTSPAYCKHCGAAKEFTNSPFEAQPVGAAPNRFNPTAAPRSRAS